MKFIAHRGNWNGRNEALENSPEYILEAVKRGYDVEIDLWAIDEEIYLGHDSPVYKIDEDFLIKVRDVAWIHAKNYRAVGWLHPTPYHWFWHENDRMVLTSQNYIWCYSEVFVDECIVNQPCDTSIFWNNKMWLKSNIAGLCHDNLITCQERMLAK